MYLEALRCKVLRHHQMGLYFISTQALPLLCHWKDSSFTTLSCSLRADNNRKMKTWFLKLKVYNKVWASSEHESHQRDGAIQRWGYQNRIRYQTVSYEAEQMWSPVVHMLKHCAQDLKWAEWIITCMHALAHSNAVQNSQLGITSKSLHVVSRTSNINITKIYSSSCVCGGWTDSTGMLFSNQ